MSAIGNGFRETYRLSLDDSSHEFTGTALELIGHLLGDLTPQELQRLKKDTIPAVQTRKNLLVRQGDDRAAEKAHGMRVAYVNRAEPLPGRASVRVPRVYDPESPQPIEWTPEPEAEAVAQGQDEPA